MDEKRFDYGQVLFHPVYSECFDVCSFNELADLEISQTDVLELSYGQKLVEVTASYIPGIEWLKEW